jgi:hypothetical protein
MRPTRAARLADVECPGLLRARIRTGAPAVAVGVALEAGPPPPPDETRADLAQLFALKEA